MDFVAWQGPAIAAGVSAGGAVFLWWLKRQSDIVTEFRKALDRGRIRENALASVCEILIYAIDHTDLDSLDPKVARAVRDLRARALAVLVDARRLTHGKGDE